MSSPSAVPSAMPFISGVNINISLDFDLVLPRVFARLSSCWARFDRVGYGVLGLGRCCAVVLLLPMHAWCMVRVIVRFACMYFGYFYMHENFNMILSIGICAHYW